MEDKYIVRISKHNDARNSAPPSPPAEAEPVPENTPLHPTSKPKMSGTFYVALHITDHEIYALQITHETKLTRFGKSVLPEHTVENGVILAQEQLARHIRTLLEEVFLSKDLPKIIHGHICIPKSQTYIQHFVLPNAEESLHYELVSEKLSELIPFSMSEVSVGFTHWEEDQEEHITAEELSLKIINTQNH